MEVPTIISYSSLLQRTLEQIVDIPVPQGRVARGGLGGIEGVSQRQGSTALCGADPVDIPRSGGLQGFFPGQGSTASSSSSHVRAGVVDEPFQGGFRTFLRLKKSAGLGPHSGSELGADFTPWTPAAYAESMAGAYDKSEAESEAEVVVEEGAVTRFADGFRPVRVCSTSWDGLCGGVPMATGAPSHTHGLSFTGKLQPMSENSPRTFQTEAVVVASGPEGGPGRRGGGK